MAEAELNIVLKLLDQATDEIKKSMDGVGKEAEKAGKKQEEVSKKTESGFKKAGDAIKALRREMFAASVAIGIAAVAINELGKRNENVRKALDEIGIAIRKVAAESANLVFLGLAIEFLGKGAEKFNDIFGDTYTEVERGKREITEFNNQLKDQEALFLTGRLMASDYYETILSSQHSIINVNKQMQDNLNQLAQLQVQVGRTAILETERQTQEQIALLNEYKQNHFTAYAGMAAFTTTLSQSIKANLGSAISSIVTGASTAKEAFTNLGRAMIETIVNFMAQKVIAWVLEKTLLAGTVASSVAAAGAIALAWKPAALLVSLATGGANAAGAITGITLAALALGSVLGGLSAATTAASVGAGGLSAGASGSAGTATPGNVAMFTRAHGGDDIVTKPTLFLAGENGPERATFTPLSGSAGTPVGGDIYINVNYPQINSGSDIKKMAEVLGLEIQRELRYARSI